MATSSPEKKREICQRRKEEMEIYNKGTRDVIIKRADIISVTEGELKDGADPISHKLAHIEPEMICEVKDEVAEKLIKLYPGEIVRWGKEVKKKR
jgi:hypothetical protein